MSYVTSPFEVMAILLGLCILAAFGIVFLINKFHDFPWKIDLAIGVVATLALFVGATRAIF